MKNERLMAAPRKRQSKPQRPKVNNHKLKSPHAFYNEHFNWNLGANKKLISRPLIAVAIFERQKRRSSNLREEIAFACKSNESEFPLLLLRRQHVADFRFWISNAPGWNAAAAAAYAWVTSSSRMAPDRSEFLWSDRFSVFLFRWTRGCCRRQRRAMGIAENAACTMVSIRNIYIYGPTSAN